MNPQQVKYELLREQTHLRQKHTYIQVCLLLALCSLSSIVVYATWTVIYRRNLNIPPKLVDIPDSWINREKLYSEYIHNHHNNYPLNPYVHFDNNLNNNNKKTINNNNNNSEIIKEIDNEKIYPSKLGNYIYSKEFYNNKPKLICYYDIPNINDQQNQSRKQIRQILLPKNIDPFLCTHINIGFLSIDNNFAIDITNNTKNVLNDINYLKNLNKNLKILLWVGGINSINFRNMIKNHKNRKLFIKSIKFLLDTYRLDGIDIDWEFPNGFINKERQHFSQLLHEIRREYEREHRTYILSVAVAAPQTIVDVSYDVGEINNYADYINVMTYDYHFYSKMTPFTGLNSPLYNRHNEHSIFATLNINYTVNYWQSLGMDKSKIIIGLPTYGHSFRLVNAFNTGLMSPAESIGSVGSDGFTSYSEVCWFKQNNIYVTTMFDYETCSPYLYSGNEWISYENEKSLECKTNYIKANGFGGAMIFSLNTDDFGSYCASTLLNNNHNDDDKFPLVRKINSILFN